MSDMKSAMKDKDTTRLESIRLLRAAIQRKEVDERQQLDDQGVLQVVQKLVKQCRDAADQFTRGGREDLADKENANIAVLQHYLPAALSDREIDHLIGEALSQTGATSMKDMGKVMGILRPALQGRADMAKVSARIKSRLS